jgi:hypothetical protein
MADVIKGAVYDALTGEVEEKILNADELANLRTIKDEAEAIAMAKEAQVLARESARAKLSKLGLSPAEIAALGIAETETPAL